MWIEAFGQWAVNKIALDVSQKKDKKIFFNQSSQKQFDYEFCASNKQSNDYPN